jgi:uncharacterized protein
MKILIVGISVRAMAESAVHSGYPIIALDAFGDRDLHALTEAYSLRRDFHARYSPRALFKAGHQLAYDAIAYTSNLENHPEILSRFARSHGIIGNSPQTVFSVRNWKSLFARLRKAGFSVPETIFPEEEVNIDNGRRWLIKPILSGGGHGIEFLNGEKHPGDSFVVQEWISGKSCSASFIANGKECVLIGIAEQLIGMSHFGSYGFRYCGNILPLPETLVPDTGRRILEQAGRLAAFLTREYGLTGVNGMDFMLSDDRIILTELNPRYSASMELIEQAYELPIFHLHAQAVLNGRLPEFRLESRLVNPVFYGKSILFAERDTIMPDTSGWATRSFCDIPAPGEWIPKGGPVCTIKANKPSYVGTKRALIRKAKAVKKEIYE